jgi:hypothetical protein
MRDGQGPVQPGLKRSLRRRRGDRSGEREDGKEEGGEAANEGSGVLKMSRGAPKDSPLGP